jgi:hypothetical protein
MVKQRGENVTPKVGQEESFRRCEIQIKKVFFSTVNFETGFAPNTHFLKF